MGLVFDEAEDDVDAGALQTNVRPGMFETWLGLFDAVLKRNLPADLAAAWSELAHRIGRGLRAGVVERAEKDGVPILR